MVITTAKRKRTTKNKEITKINDINIPYREFVTDIHYLVTCIQSIHYREEAKSRDDMKVFPYDSAYHANLLALLTIRD